MKNLLLVLVMTVLSVGLFSCSGDTERYQKVLAENDTLQNEKHELESVLGDKNKMIDKLEREALVSRSTLAEIAREDSLAENSLVQNFWTIDFSVINLDTVVDLDNSSILSALTCGGGGDGYVSNIAYKLKYIWEDSGILAGKLQKPENMNKLYNANKNVVQTLLPYSATLKDVYRDAEVIADYFSGNVSEAKKDAFDNYFTIHDGESVYFDSDQEGYTEVSTAFHGNINLAKDQYLLYLSAKRQKTRFGEKWCDTVAEILRDFGEVE